MKKLLSGIVAIALFIGLATNVNAATLSVNKTEVNEGDTVSVTVRADKTTDSITTDVKYDAEAFEYVTGSVSSNIKNVDATAENGVVSVVSYGTDDVTGAYVTLTFKAKKTADAASFEVTKLRTNGGEAAPAATTVKVVEETATPEDNTNTDNSSTGTTGTTESTETATTTSSESTSSAKVDDQGKVITKLPQTGVNYVAVAGIVLMLVAGVVVTLKK